MSMYRIVSNDAYNRMKATDIVQAPDLDAVIARADEIIEEKSAAVADIYKITAGPAYGDWGTWLGDYIPGEGFRPRGLDLN